MYSGCTGLGIWVPGFRGLGLKALGVQGSGVEGLVWVSALRVLGVGGFRFWGGGFGAFFAEGFIM